LIRNFTDMSRSVVCTAACLLSACAGHRTVSSAAPKGFTPAPVRQQVLNAVQSADGDFALTSLRARLDANPRDLDTRLALADRYVQLGFNEVAIEHLRLACERAPDSDEAHIALARMLRADSQTAEAGKMLAAFTVSYPAAGAAVWAWLGLVRDDGEDWKAGEEAHRKALALAPDRDEFHNNLGFCLLRQGKRTEAATEFRTALRLHPHSVIAENNLALALIPDSKNAADSENTKDSVAHLQSVTDPATAHSNLAVAFIEAGKYAEAHREIEIALRYNRSNSAALSNLQLLSELEGRPAEIHIPENRVRAGWTRVVNAWRNLRGNSAPEGQKTINSDATVASR
jgi:Flp pilus assembly protein TadD